MKLSRNFFVWLLLGVMLCAVSMGGCGGSDSDPTGASVDWTELAGTWTPAASSYVRFFESGQDPITFNLVESDTDDVTVSVTKTDDYYVLRFSDGGITFKGSKSHNGSRIFAPAYEDLPNSYKASGKTLRSEISNGNMWDTTQIEYISMTKVKVTFSEKDTTDGSREVTKAEVTLNRAGVSEDDEE